MKRLWLFCAVAVCLLICRAACASDGTPIDKAHFPDKHFRNYVLNHFDTDKDKYLSTQEASAVDFINLNHSDAASLEGLRYFPALKELICSGSKLKALDVSNNTALEKLYCSNMPLGSLDVSHNTALIILECLNDGLKSLDVSMLPRLTHLACSVNQLSFLDVTANKSLIYLSCDQNQLTALKLGSHKAMKSLSCYYNYLTELNLSGCPALTYLACHGNSLTVLNVRKNTALTELICSHNRLTCLDLSANKKLTSLDAGNCRRDFTLTRGEFDLSTLPGFDPKHASNWLNAGVDGSLLIPDGGMVEYLYDCGNGFTVRFSLGFSVTAVPSISSVKLSYTHKAYTGKPLMPKATVKAEVDGVLITLKKGEDYTIAYSNNINAGTATVTVTGIGDYEGTLEQTFTIIPASLTKLTLRKTSAFWTGQAIEPKVIVKATVKGKTVTLAADKDYKVIYKNNTEPGKASITVKGKGNFTGSLSKTFTIKRVKLLDAKLKKSVFSYNGKAHKPTPTVTAKVMGDIVTLKKSRDYTVTYENNKSRGTATVTITGIGHFTGTITLQFSIQ